VDSQTAYDYVKKIYDFGSRPSGSENLSKLADFIAKTAAGAGASVIFDEFEDSTPAGTLKFINVIADVKGRSDKFIIIASHYDTKKLSGVPCFTGANDGASTTGLLLAMLNAVKDSGQIPEYSLKFVFFDGEESLYNYSPKDGLHGSRHYADKLFKSGELKNCAAFVLLDMVGDKDLKITLPASSTNKRLAELLFKTAGNMGTAKHFTWYNADILDDHMPFYKLGVPCINLIDFDYGQDNMYWHTSADTIDKISPESLKITGDAALALIWKL
jgi:glutaminyl-peptide cyclotransferase